MAKPITLLLQPDDAEPILKQYADMAAMYGALLDYTTRRTGECPNVGYGRSYDQARIMWQEKFLRAKRMVEAFGVTVDPISEQETLTVGYPFIRAGARHPTENRKVGDTEGVQDLSKPYPKWRGEIARDSCRFAAERVVRAWRATLGG